MDPQLAPLPMKAHQRVVRERQAVEAADANLFGRWWDTVDTRIEHSVVREVSMATARKIVEDYEYLGTMPNAPIKAYGIFFGAACGGVVVYGAVSPPSVARSVIGAPWSARVIQLARGACVHWAHEHSASRLIGQSLRLIAREGWQVVIAYADARAGEIGTVYQASNWLYCGETTVRPEYLDGGGNLITGPIGKVQPWMTHRPRPRKGRYVYLLGSRTNRAALRRALRWTPEPYPKRAP